MSVIKLGIHGGAGRLGRRILALAFEDARVRLAAVVVRKGSPWQGQDIGELAGRPWVGIAAQSDPATLLDCDVVIDVSSPAAGAKLAGLLALHGGPGLLTGTTGWNDQQAEVLRRAGGKIALLASGNFSIGVAALVQNVRATAARLGPNWGVHIHDSHHSAKKDAPSGTALMLAKAVSEGWAKEIAPKCLPVGEALEKQVGPSEVIITATRKGEVIGTHTVNFIGSGETVELSHIAQNRDIFAAGALQAAHWLAVKPAGFYSMDDMLTPG